MRWGKAVAALVTIAAILLAAYALWPRGRGAPDLARQIRTAEVEAANFYISLRFSGSLEPIQSHPIVTVMVSSGSRFRGGGATNVVWTQTDGARVKAGDVVVKLDAAQAEQQVSDVGKEAVELNERVRSADADGRKNVDNARTALTKAKEALALTQTENRASLERAQSELAYQETELEVAQGQLDARQQLAKEGLVTITELEAAQDEVRQRKFSRDKAERALTRAREDAQEVERLRQLDIKNAELGLAAAERALKQGVAEAQRNLEAKEVELEEAQEQVAGTQLRAPVDGLLLLSRSWRGEPVKVGDEIWPGRRLASVVPPGEMYARCSISEDQIEQVKVGQQATIVVPALGDQRLQGEVKAIDNLAREKDWWESGVPGKKVFAALIAFKNKDERLRPGLGATIEVLLRRVTKGLAVPGEAVFEYKGKQAVYRYEEAKFRPIPVTVTQRSDLFAAVEGKLKRGDTVACERPPASVLVAMEEPK